MASIWSMWLSECYMNINLYKSNLIFVPYYGLLGTHSHTPEGENPRSLRQVWTRLKTQLYPSEFTLPWVKCHKILIDLPSNLFAGITTPKYTIITLALVGHLRNSVVRALHRHRKGVGSIPAGGPWVDEFFSTVPGWFLTCVWFPLELKAHLPFRMYNKTLLIRFLWWSKLWRSREKLW